jgi:hypothetical protein
MKLKLNVGLKIGQEIHFLQGNHPSNNIMHGMESKSKIEGFKSF